MSAPGYVKLECHSLPADEFERAGAVVVNGVRFDRARECVLDGTINWQWTGPTTYYEHTLTCGHVVTSVDKEPPRFCEECGARVLR